MASRKQVEEMLLLSFIHGFISEEEFGVLHEALQTKNPIFPHSDYERSGAPNENIVQNHLNIALLNVF